MGHSGSGVLSEPVPMIWHRANYTFSAALVLTASALILPAIGLATGMSLLIDEPGIAFLTMLVLCGLVSWVFGRWLVRTTREDTPTATYEKTRDTVVSSWLVMVIGWAAWTFYIDSGGVGGPTGPTRTIFVIAALVGISVSLGSGLFLIALAHHRVRLAAVQGEDIVVRHDLKSHVARVVPWIIGAIVLIAVVFPSDVSPFRVSDINRWMERLTNSIGPAFVPKDNPASKLRQAIPFSASRLMGQGSGAGETSPLYFAFQIIVFVLLAMGVVRIYRSRKTRRDRSTMVGGVPWGFRWLWDEIKEMIARWFSRLTRWASGESRSQAVVSKSDGKYRARRRARAHPSTVEAWYALVLQRAARRGLQHHPAETPYEFLVRWRTWRADDRKPNDELKSTDDRELTDDREPGNDAASKVEDSGAGMEPFPVLTELVVQTRYSGVYAPSWLDRARRAAIGSLRQLSRLRLRRRSRTDRSTDH